MKKLIIRKPKFMRSEELMQRNIEAAQAIQKEIKEHESTLMDSQYADLWDSWWYYIGEAAKKGGFFNVDDFREWANREGIKLM